MKANFHVYLTTLGYGNQFRQQNKEEGEMVKWRDVTDTMDKRKRENLLS